MIMTQLKEATAALHDAVEAQMPVLRPDLTRAEYTQLLVQVHWAVAPLDAQVQALDLPGVFLTAQRQKTPLLRRDLAALGAAVPPYRSWLARRWTCPARWAPCTCWKAPRWAGR